MAAWYARARDLFEAARDAAKDAERCGAELLAIDSAPAIGSPSFEARVRGSRDPDRMGRKVAAAIDRKGLLHPAWIHISYTRRRRNRGQVIYQ